MVSLEMKMINKNKKVKLNYRFVEDSNVDELLLVFKVKGSNYKKCWLDRNKLKIIKRGKSHTVSGHAVIPEHEPGIIELSWETVIEFNLQPYLLNKNN